MTIVPISAFNDNYIWAIINEMDHTFFCVDPGDVLPVLNYATINQLKLTGALLTHHHADHIGGVPELLAAFPNLQVYGPEDERIPWVNKVVKNEDIIHLDQFDFRILSIPGHTSTHICYQEPAQGWLFCGDTLFSAGCGRVFDGTIEKLHHSLQLLKQLPSHTQIFCGHEYTRNNLKFAATIEPDNEILQGHLTYLTQHPNMCSLPSTLALEKEINPFLRTEYLTAFAFKQGLDPNDSLGIFKKLRELKNLA